MIWIFIHYEFFPFFGKLNCKIFLKKIDFAPLKFCWKQNIVDFVRLTFHIHWMSCAHNLKCAHFFRKTKLHCSKDNIFFFLKKFSINIMQIAISKKINDKNYCATTNVKKKNINFFFENRYLFIAFLPYRVRLNFVIFFYYSKFCLFCRSWKEKFKF